MFFNSRCVDASLAEEATVDCFYRVWNKCRQHRAGGDAEAWIFRIAHRALLDLARGRQRWWKRLLAGSRNTEHDQQPGPLEEMVETETQQRRVGQVNAALQGLPEEDRALVHLYYYEGRTLAEIATILETSRDAMKMRLSRLRRRLAKQLEAEDDQ